MPITGCGKPKPEYRYSLEPKRLTPLTTPSEHDLCGATSRRYSNDRAPDIAPDFLFICEHCAAKAGFIW
jgi:hypothetical protein